MLKKISCIVTIMCVFCILGCNEVCAVKGIDVSQWQENIEYSKVKNQGIEVVYIKASQGENEIDPYFEANYRNAKANGLKVGVYHFLTATTVDEAIKEAEHFCSVVSGKDIDCLLAMDFERIGNLSNTEINNISFSFLKKVEELTKKDVVIYSDLSNLIDKFSNELVQKYPVWIAEYGVDKPQYDGNWVGFQYTDTGIVDGINGYVDMDEFKDEIFLDTIKQSKNYSQPSNNTVIYTIKKR